ncbi:MAG: twin-arginine translocase subunit TatC [Anaerolineae bacterium]|jgi:sec-independent protein translocase protein TatC
MAETSMPPERLPGAASGGAPDGQAEAEQGVMPLMEHLKELRNRLIRAFLALAITTGVSFFFVKQVLQFLIAPMGDTMPQVLKPTEALGNYMKVALICGVTLAMPVIVYQIARFVAPGLTKQEKRWLFVLVPGATLCFVAGAAFAYFVMMPAAIPFLQGFLADVVEQNWQLSEYLSFVTNLLLWIGIAFELPLFVFFLAKLGLVNAEMLSRNRKYAIVGIAVVAAVITPTVDPLNMALVMGPLIVLYELGVILAKLA